MAGPLPSPSRCGGGREEKERCFRFETPLRELTPSQFRDDERTAARTSMSSIPFHSITPSHNASAEGMAYDEVPPMAGPTLLDEGRGLGLCAVAASGPISSFQGGSFSANTGQDALGMDIVSENTECEYLQLAIAHGRSLITSRREQRSLWRTTRLLTHSPDHLRIFVLNPRLETTSSVPATLSKDAPSRRRRRGNFRSRRPRSRACPGRRRLLLACAATQSRRNPAFVSVSCTVYPTRLIAARRTDRLHRRRGRQRVRLLLLLRPGSVRIPPRLFRLNRTVRRKTSFQRSLPRRVAVPSARCPCRQPDLARVALRAARLAPKPMLSKRSRSRSNDRPCLLACTAIRRFRSRPGGLPRAESRSLQTCLLRRHARTSRATAALNLRGDGVASCRTFGCRF